MNTNKSSEDLHAINLEQYEGQNNINNNTEDPKSIRENDKNKEEHKSKINIFYIFYFLYINDLFILYQNHILMKI